MNYQFKFKNEQGRSRFMRSNSQDIDLRWYRRFFFFCFLKKMEKWESLRYVEHLDEFLYVHLEKEPDRDVIWSGLEGGREEAQEKEREKMREGEKAEAGDM